MARHAPAKARSRHSILERARVLLHRLRLSIGPTSLRSQLPNKGRRGKHLLHGWVLMCGRPCQGRALSEVTTSPARDETVHMGASHTGMRFVARARGFVEDTGLGRLQRVVSAGTTSRLHFSLSCCALAGE